MEKARRQDGDKPPGTTPAGAPAGGLTPASTPSSTSVVSRFSSKAWRLVIYLIAMGASLLSTAIILVEVLYRAHVRPQLETNIAVQKKHLDTFLSDLQKVDAIPMFRALQTTRSGRADAGAFLNSKVYWTPAPNPKLNLKPFGSPRQLVGPNTREILLRLNDDWMKKHPRAKTMKADLSVFVGLDRFDYWDIETNSPIAELADKQIYVHPSRLPVPDVQDLLALAKVRLMISAVNGATDFIPALNDVRLLARLLLTTENQQLMLTGLALFDIERFAYQYFVTDRKMPANVWVPIEREINQTAQKAIYSTRGYLRLWTPAVILEQVYHREPAPMAFCAAVNEALPNEYALRHLLEPQMPLEIRLRSEYSALDSIYRRAHSLCRLRYLSEMMAHDKFTTRTPGPFILGRMPWARKVFALRLSVFGFHSTY